MSVSESENKDNARAQNTSSRKQTKETRRHERKKNNKRSENIRLIFVN